MYTPGGGRGGSSTPAGFSAGLSGGSAGSAISTPSAPGPVGMGDLRSRLVRERSRSSASAFGSMGAGSHHHPRTPGSTRNTSSSSSVRRLGLGLGLLREDGRGQGGITGDRGGTYSPAGTAEDAAELLECLSDEESNAPLFTSMCHGGIEVLVAAVNSREEPTYLLVVHSRTRAPFQKLRVGGPGGASNSQNDNRNGGASAEEVVALSSHPASGHIYAVLDNGIVRSFYPVRADPMRVAYGKYTWLPGRAADVREAFGHPPLVTDGGVICSTPRGGGVIREAGGGVEVLPNETRDDRIFSRGENGNESTRNMSASSSHSLRSLPGDYPLDESGQPPLPSSGRPDRRPRRGVLLRPSMFPSRVLLAHGDALAVYDFSRPPDGDARFGNVNHAEREAECVWSRRVEGCTVDHAAISGDGNAVAAALRGEGVGVPYPFGVRTFVRSAGGDDTMREEGGVKEETAGGDEINESSGLGSTGKPPLALVRKRSGSGLTPTKVTPPLPGSPAPGSDNRKSLDGRLPALDDIDPLPFPGAGTDPGASASGGSARNNRAEYAPGPFLVHSAPPSRLAFRGRGTRTSSASHLPSNGPDGGSNSNSSGYDGGEMEEGNDLLLTSSTDCTVRIFSQNSWRQLMSWTTPPETRADWVEGISMGNLGDLDEDPSSGGSNGGGGNGGNGGGRERGGAGDSGASPPDRQSDDDSAGINRSLLGPSRVHPSMSYPPSSSSSPPSSAPSTHAGAWVAEVTFRGPCPALRLSRLSYVRAGGEDAMPAHFESVAAILPPGSLDGAVVETAEGGGGGGGGGGGLDLSVEGVWPVWDWEGDRRRNGVDRLGGAGGGTGGGGGQQSSFPTTTSAPRWISDGAELGGSHMPPSELRITSTAGRHLVQMEMPLWGDRDLGAMEFGSPLRHVMALPLPREGLAERVYRSLPPNPPALPSATLDYEGGSKLVARAAPGEGYGGEGEGGLTEIELVWHRHGAVNLEEVFDGRHRRRGKAGGKARSHRTFKDVGLTPLPLVLPPLSLPAGPTPGSDDGGPSPVTPSVSSLHWWPDDNHGGPPRLAALTTEGSMVVYEMPPPQFALEPPMPAYDPFADDAR